MIKESERFYQAPLILVIISEKTIFAGREGFSLSNLGVDLQRIFVDCHALEEIGEANALLIKNRKNSIEATCQKLGIQNKGNILDILEEQFTATVQKRTDAALDSISPKLTPS